MAVNLFQKEISPDKLITRLKLIIPISLQPDDENFYYLI